MPLATGAAVGVAVIAVRALHPDRFLPVVLGFTAAVAVLTGILFGLVPAIQTSRSDLQSVIKEGSRGMAAERGGQTLRRSLVVAEVALALVLLAGSGLLLKSFARLQAVAGAFYTGVIFGHTVENVLRQAAEAIRTSSEDLTGRPSGTPRGVRSRSGLRRSCGAGSRCAPQPSACRPR